MQEKQNDFTKNSMAYNIMSLAIPMTIAQLINVLYSLVDRMYIGHLAQNSTLALTGLGITFPIIMLVTAVLIYLVWVEHHFVLSLEVEAMMNGQKK